MSYGLFSSPQRVPCLIIWWYIFQVSFVGIFSGFHLVQCGYPGHHHHNVPKVKGLACTQHCFAFDDIMREACGLTATTIRLAVSQPGPRPVFPRLYTGHPHYHLARMSRLNCPTKTAVCETDLQPVRAGGTIGAFC